MAEVEIKVKIDGVEYTQEQLKALAKSGKQAADGIEDTTDAVKDLGKESKKAEKESGFLSERFNGIKDTFSKLKADAKGVASGFVNFAKGLGLSSKAAKGLAVGLSALGIPLLLAAIAALIDYFKNFEGAAKLVQKALEVAGAVIRKITEAMIALINLDFAGVKEALGGIGDAASEAARGVDELFESQRALEAMQKQQVIQNAKLRQSIEAQKKVLEDTTLSFEERMEALKEVNKDTEQLAKNEIALTEATLRNLQAQLALENNYEERIRLEQEIAQTQADLINSQTELQNIQYDAAKVERELLQQRADEQQAAADKALEIRKNYYSQLNTINQQNELMQIEDEDERAKRALQIQRENAIKEIQESEFNAKQKRELIAAINESFDLQEEARVETQNDKIAEKEKAAGQKLLQIQNELDLLQETNQRAKQELMLQQQEEAALQSVEGLENEEALKEAIREKYRLLREQNEMTAQEKIQQILSGAGEDGEVVDPFEKAEQELQLQQDTLMAELENLGASEQQKQALLASFKKKRENLAKEEADYKMALERQVSEANLQVASQALSAVASLVGENTVAGKAAAIAATTIDTYLSAQKAYASQLLPGDPTSPVRAAIAAGVAVAAGIANVQKIISTPTPGAAGGGGGGGGGSAPSRPNIPTFSPNTGSLQLGFDQTPGVGESGAIGEVAAGGTAAEATQPVLKTYVVATEMTDAQEKNKAIEDIAKL